MDNSKSMNCEQKNCRKKLRLTDFSCRCNKRFCPDHRMCENHGCDYDFKRGLKKVEIVNEMKCVKTKIAVI